MRITKKQLRRIIREQTRHQDLWTDAILDFIYDEVAASGDLESNTPSIIAALKEVIQVLESEEANPSDGTMYGEERY